MNPEQKLLPPACGRPHWFPLTSPFLPYPVQYEMTAVSKLNGTLFVDRPTIEEILRLDRAQNDFRRQLLARALVAW